MSSQVSKKVVVQVPFKKENGIYSFTQVLFNRSTSNEVSDTLFPFLKQLQVLLHWWLIPRLPLDSVNLATGWKKCKPWETLHWKAHPSLICESAGKHFQISSGSCSTFKCSRPYSASLLFFRLHEQLWNCQVADFIAQILLGKGKQKQSAPEVNHVRRENNLKEYKLRILWFISP